MGANSIGKVLQLTCFGESHGTLTGAVLDGFPSNYGVNSEFIQHQLNRRRPGQSAVASLRDEKDTCNIVSGIFENKTTGAPVTFLIENKNQKSEDYELLKETYRPSHADFTFEKKYGIRDHRGGGRSSARITAPVVAAGAMVQEYLLQQGITIFAYVQSIYTIDCALHVNDIDARNIDANMVRCPDENAAVKMIAAIDQAKTEGDSLGGTIICVIKNCPVGLGEPFFGKLHADLAHAMMSINAVKGFEYGSGFEITRMKGSESNDAFSITNNRIHTLSNHSGGIQGGISNGEDIWFKVAFKPPASIAKSQQTVNASGSPVAINVNGRHDPCVLPRAVPIVETMSALVIGDHYLRQQIYR